MAGEKLIRRAIQAARETLSPEELLMGIHNTRSGRGLEMVERLGGLPAPSIAVTKPAQGYTSFGDISLVAPVEMVTPGRKTPAFGSDVYSPRFPSVEDDQIFRGFTSSGKRRYAPVTMENVLREMKGPIRGGENFSYGPASIRAQVTPQFGSLPEMQAAREKIIPASEFGAQKEISEEMLERLRERFEPYFKPTDPYRQSWSAFPEVMTDYARTGRPSEFAYDYKDLPAEALTEARSFLGHLRNMPTEYFEVKPQRGVPLSEFAGAVVPGDVPGEVVDRLRRLGVSRIEEYGDDASRRDALMKFVDEQGFAQGGEVEGGRLLEDEYPTHYLPNVGRQVMADGGMPEFPMSEGERNAQLNDAIAYADRLSRAERMGEARTALAQTWPVQMAKSVVGGLALPGDVAAGRVDPTSEIGVQRALDLAGSVMGGGMTVGSAPRGSIGMFLGPSAKTADLQALDLAREMTQKGASREDVIGKTGWFQGADGKWRFEIPDTAASLRPGYTDKTTVQEAISHPELFRAYPQLGEVEFYHNPMTRTNIQGGWSGNPNVSDTFPTLQINQAAKDPRSTAIHELQHAVQAIEDFAPGGNTFVLKKGTPAWEIYQERLAAIKKPLPLETYAAVAGFGDDIEAARKSYPSYLKAVKNPSSLVKTEAQKYAVETAYRRSAGEVEARNVQSRLKSGYDKRPWETQDFPEDMQIVTKRERAEGGAVEDALDVVRAQPTAQSRRRATIAAIQPDAPEFSPEERGRMFRQAVENYSRFPVRPGEATLSSYDQTPRERFGQMLAGDEGEQTPGGRLRSRLASAAVGTTGLEGSGIGFGLADLPMATGIPLMAADVAGSASRGNYGEAAMGAALPAAYYARKPIMAAGRAVYDAGARAVDTARDVLSRVPAPVAAGAAGAAVMTPEEAEAGKADIVRRGLEAVTRTNPPPLPRSLTLDEVRRTFDPQAGVGMSPREIDLLTDAYSKVASPAMMDPELAQLGQEIAQGYITKRGSEFGGRSFFRQKPSVPLEELGRATTSIPVSSELRPIVEKSWQQVARERQGSPVITLGGDLSDWNRVVGYGPQDNLYALSRPSDIHAGFDYMREPNPYTVWANNLEHAAVLDKKVQQQKDILRAVDKDLPIMATAAPMGPQSIDSAKNMMDMLLSAIEGRGIHPEYLKDATAYLKSGAFGNTPKAKAAYKKKMEGFPGFENPEEARQFLLNNPEIAGTVRGDIVKGLERKDWVKKGFPEIGQLRYAASSPQFGLAAGNLMGGRMVEIDPALFGRAMKDKMFSHMTYPGDTFGRYYADVPLVHRQYGAPDAMDELMVKYNQWRPGAKKSDPPKPPITVHPFSLQQSGRDTARKMFEEQRMIQRINERMLESIERGEQRRPLYGFMDGGEVVDRAIDLAKELGSSPREPVKS